MGPQPHIDPHGDDTSICGPINIVAASHKAQAGPSTASWATTPSWSTTVQRVALRPCLPNLAEGSGDETGAGESNDELQ
jgi:hypothetical protein